MARSSPPQIEYSPRQKLKNLYGGNPPAALGYAVKAWREGTANEAQQRATYDYVVEVLAGLNDPEFAAPADVAVTNWRAGRRFVGLQINELVSTPVKSVL